MRPLTGNMSFRRGSTLLLMLAFAAPAAAEWSSYAGGKTADRYSPLAQIDAENVSQLKIVWRRPAVDPSLTGSFPDIIASSYFRGTPIVVGSVLYAPNGVGLVEAFDGITGKTLWVQQPFAPSLRETVGNSSRGVEYWRSGADERIFSIKGSFLYALDAKTGSLIRSFGDRGRVSLRRGTPGDLPYFGVNGPLVVNDLVIVSGNGGGNAGDGGVAKEATPEDVRAYDVRTGKLVWTFNVMPRPGTAERASWGKESAGYSGNMGPWATLSADIKRGIVYLPLSSVTNAYYGGHRPGDNLYSNSLAAVNARTGQLIWHYQLVRHDLWDYDTASPPSLGTLRVSGKRIDAVIQPSKTGNLFVFDRSTGAPVWPIEQRAVPASDVPGEAASPTQPFPTKPPPFDRQTMSEEDLIDFTPELNAEAKKIASRYKLGGVFTPPIVRGTGGKQGVMTLPGAWGAGNWNTGAFDPETGWYYTVSMTAPSVYALDKPTSDKATIDYAMLGRDPEPPSTSVYGIGPKGLPLIKPPYGRITAYNMNKGEIAWMAANGDGPRNHPLLKDLNLPPLGSIGRPAPLLTKTLLFLGESSDSLYGEQGLKSSSTFRAYDKMSGKVVAEIALPAGQTAGPMTYMAGGRQFIVVTIGSKEHAPEWIAFALDRGTRK
jgi:glucose dehydrogenase